MFTAIKDTNNITGIENIIFIPDEATDKDTFTSKIADELNYCERSVQTIISICKGNLSEKEKDTIKRIVEESNTKINKIVKEMVYNHENVYTPLYYNFKRNEAFILFIYNDNDKELN